MTKKQWKTKTTSNCDGDNCCVQVAQDLIHMSCDYTIILSHWWYGSLGHHDSQNKAHYSSNTA